MKTFSTRKSLYPPVEIQIDETVYRSHKLTHEAIAMYAEIEERIKNPDLSIDATYEWVSSMFGVEMKVLKKLEVREVEDIYLYVSKELRDTEKKRMKKQIDSFESDLKQLKKVEDVTKKIPNSKNVKRSGSKK